MNSKLHAVADAKGRPIRLLLTAGQTSDYMGARLLLPTIPQTGALLADRGYDAEVPKWPDRPRYHTLHPVQESTSCP